jgi:two-component sensor histidine kinase
LEVGGFWMFLPRIFLLRTSVAISPDFGGKHAVVMSGQVESLLIAELRHRLANSFQLLQAVIQIRLRSAEDPESRKHLSWLLDVVTALGMLQQRIGPSGPTDFGAYLIEAATYWRRICEGGAIGIVLDVQAVQVSETEASTLALIAHELICNAIEHAFPDGGPGSIQLRLLQRRDGVRELTITDNGCGLPQGGGTDGRQGLALVRGLASHLGGRIDVESGDGLTARVSVPRDPGPLPH